MTKEQFGARLRELREKLGLTQADLAAKAGIAKLTLARFELGERSPTWEKVVALAEVLGVECTAFTQAPAELPRPAGERRIGRPPRKSAAGRPAKPKGKRRGQV